MATATEAPANVTAEGPTSHTQNQADTRPANTYGYTRAEQIDALHKLREPFLPKEVRHLPRVWCGACKNSRGQGCQQHSIVKCDKCNQKMPRNGHIDLAYVGHAEATNRLLNVDPFWDWEPLTVDERGLPQFDGYRGLWIRLTVCGMTRLGYGHAGDKTGGDALKEVIGDAIRNAGMRFGMALDLWTSSDLEIVESGGASLDEAGAGSGPSPKSGGEQPVAASTPKPAPRQQTSQQASPPAVTAPAAPARDFLAEAREAPTQDAVRDLYDEAKAANVMPAYLAQIAQVGQTKPTGPDPIDQLVAQVQRAWGDGLELTKVLAEAGRRNQLLREVDGPTGSMVQFGDMVTARIQELKEHARQAELNGHTETRERSAA
ncbi:hypothetical protein ACFVG1_12950 [Streptomyces bacillaris]|uniref:hypothetical protein n=1 Tax=Streptomyces bacillaris TaxID=68179 RepID=UPI0035DAB38A